MRIRFCEVLRFVFCLIVSLAFALGLSSCRIPGTRHDAVSRSVSDSDQHSSEMADAILAQDEIRLKVQLASGANPRSLWKGERLIQHATWAGFKRGIELLVSFGAKVDEEGLSDRNALMDAANQANCEMITLLLALGANVNYRNREGQTALMFAAAGPETDRNPWIGAPKPTDTDSIRERTAHLNAVRLLLDAGAAVNVRSRWKETALKRAELFDQKEIAELLRTRGARR